MDKVTQAEWKLAGLCPRCGAEPDLSLTEPNGLLLHRVFIATAKRNDTSKCYDCWLNTPHTKGGIGIKHV